MKTTIDAEQCESADQLSQQVNKLEADRERIELQAAVSRGTLANVWVRLSTGDATLTDVTVAQARTNALEGALNKADDELSRLRVALAEAEQREDEEETVVWLEVMKFERVQSQKLFREVALDFEEMCESTAKKLSNINQQYNRAGREIRETIEEYGNIRLANRYTHERGCSWPRLRLSEQIINVLTKYGNDEA